MESLSIMKRSNCPDVTGLHLVYLGIAAQGARLRTEQLRPRGQRACSPLAMGPGGHVFKTGPEAEGKVGCVWTLGMEPDALSIPRSNPTLPLSAGEPGEVEQAHLTHPGGNQGKPGNSSHS